MTETTNQFATVRQLSQIFPSFSEASLRYLIFNAKQNGLACCIRKIGKKILINTDEFGKWIDSHHEVAK